jgi:hypothetical protein
MPSTMKRESAAEKHKHLSAGAKKGHGRSKSGQKIHVRGVGDKEERMYEHILSSAKKDGRYGGRAKEVAARTVLKHHKEEGHHPGQ